MKNIWMQISYNGENFYGMARQPKRRTVQGVLEETLSDMSKQDIQVIYSGRTDRFVHAINQYVMFSVEDNFNIDLWRIQKALNIKYKDIAIKQIWEEKDLDKHPRYSVKMKTYEYLIYNNKVNDPLKNNLTYFVKKDIDLQKMKKFSKMLIGEMNFSSFTGKTEYGNYVRTVKKISIKKDGNLIKVRITGPGFMRYMVRNIVGSLIDVSIGKISEQEFIGFIKKPTRGKSNHKAEGQGLYLVDVKY